MLALADIEHNGMFLNKEKWLKVADSSLSQVISYRKRLDNIIWTDDTFKEFRPKYIQSDLFTPLDNLRKLEINWDSPKQVYEILSKVIHGLKDTNALTLEKYSGPKILEELLRYREFQKQVTTYGPNFIQNINKKTGRVHTDFRQILNSGRSSSNNPNMQNLPANNKFRNAFESGICDWIFVSGDFSSEELCVIAVKSNDPVWISALRSGHDLHSICGKLVYGKKWEDATEPECAFERDKQKCKCKIHKILRQNVKTISFGIAYGMEASKLSQKLHISKKEAGELLEKYFNAFPSINLFLQTLAAYGQQNGKIKTFKPYKRVRYFPKWNIEMLDNGHLYSEVLGDIGRESRNHPIQGSSGDIMKKALYLALYEIYNNNLPVKLVMQVHDSIDTICHKDYAEEWKVKLKELMEEAALEIIPEGLLKADVGISEVWTKD